MYKEDPQRLFRIGDGSKAASYWQKKNLYPTNLIRDNK